MRKNIVILGAGESGTGAARLAVLAGYTVFVSDKSPIKPEFSRILEAEGIAFEAGSHDMERILAADEIVKSPGIPEKSPVMEAVRAKGIPVIGEMEFAYRYAGPCRMVAITGSNGKTTTTHLIGHILKAAGLPVRMAGNVGVSFAELIAQDWEQGRLQDNTRLFVLEVSSFQLDDIVHFRPQIAILLNITPDHLDRYGYEMGNYIRSKFRITMNQEADDLFITNQDDSNVMEFLARHPGYVRCRMEQVGADDLRHGYVRVNDFSFDLASCPLKGPHNLFNAACAIRTALHLGVSPEMIEEAIYGFTPPPHRLERIAEFDGVVWINDSKATNVDSVYYALMAMDRPVVWIVGGQDKGNDYAPLIPLAARQVKAIVCMGLENSKILAAFSGLHVPMVEAKSAEEAVRAAAGFASEGDAVLLSPACASFDLFKNYEHRGEQFRLAVTALANDRKRKHKH